MQAIRTCYNISHYQIYSREDARAYLDIYSMFRIVAYFICHFALTCYHYNSYVPHTIRLWNSLLHVHQLLNNTLISSASSFNRHTVIINILYIAIFVSFVCIYKNTIEKLELSRAHIPRAACRIVTVQYQDRGSVTYSTYDLYLLICVVLMRMGRKHMEQIRVGAVGKPQAC